MTTTSKDLAEQIGKHMHVKEKIYTIIDSFLVEAKDQNGNERSIERLNQDRHLTADALIELCRMMVEEVILKIIKKYYVEMNEDGSYSSDPHDNQLIELILQDIKKRAEELLK